MTRIKSLFRLALLVGGLLLTVTFQIAAQLPYCGTHCNCTRGCYNENECQVNGFPQSCGSWGICDVSCYCGGEC